MQDLWYEWKHAMSKDNTGGTMWFYRMVTVICPLLIVSGIIGIVAFVIGASQSVSIMALSIGLVLLPIALLVYLIKFNN